MCKVIKSEFQRQERWNLSPETSVLLKSKLGGQNWDLGNRSNTKRPFLGQKVESLEVIHILNLNSDLSVIYIFLKQS